MKQNWGCVTRHMEVANVPVSVPPERVPGLTIKFECESDAPLDPDLALGNGEILVPSRTVLSFEAGDLRWVTKWGIQVEGSQSQGMKAASSTMKTPRKRLDRRHGRRLRESSLKVRGRACV